MQKEGWCPTGQSQFPQNLKLQTAPKGERKLSCSTTSSKLSRMLVPQAEGHRDGQQKGDPKQSKSWVSKRWALLLLLYKWKSLLKQEANHVPTSYLLLRGFCNTLWSKGWRKRVEETEEKIKKSHQSRKGYKDPGRRRHKPPRKTDTWSLLHLSQKG